MEDKHWKLDVKDETIRVKWAIKCKKKTYKKNVKLVLVKTQYKVIYISLTITFEFKDSRRLRVKLGVEKVCGLSDKGRS